MHHITTETNQIGMATTKDYTVFCGSNLPNKRRCLEFSIKNEEEYRSISPTSPVSPIPSASASASALASIKDIDTIDDIFLNIAQFFVGKQSIDTQSILKIMQVSKRWHSISTSQRFWRQVPRLKSTPTDTLQTRLIRYENLGKIRSDKCAVYKIKERATGKLLRMEMNGPGEDSGYFKRHLREVCLLNDMNQLSPDFSNHLSLIQDWDICNGHTIQFYEYPEETLQSYLQKYDLRSQPSIIKGIVLQILRGVDALHQCSLIHRNLTLDRIHIHDGANCGGQVIPLVKVADFEYCRKDHELDADNCYTLDTDEGDTCKLGNSADIDSVGRLFFSMTQVHSNPNRCDKMAEDLCFVGLDQVIGADGDDLLKGLCNNPDRRMSISEAIQHKYFADVVPPHLLKSLLCHNPDRRISISETIQHKYFADIVPPHCIDAKKRCSENSQRLNILHAMESSGNGCQSGDIRFEPAQAAAMVDWLFEIASVFHINTRTVFVAVGYYNKCCRHSTIEHILGKEITGMKKYQLLAATCLHIASKCEDDVHVHVDNLSFAADRTFNQADIIALEHKVLDAIEWKLSIPTIYDFAMCYMDRIKVQSDSEHFWLTLYICELALESTIHNEFQPSIIAASASILARYSSNMQPIWTKVMGTHPNQSECLVKLSVLLEARQSFHHETSMIERRYSKPSRMSVTKICIKTICSSAQLEALKLRRF